MEILRRIAITLNRWYMVWGICNLIHSIPTTIAVVNYGLEDARFHVALLYVIPFIIIHTSCRGRKILKENNKKELVNFCLVVLAVLFVQHGLSQTVRDFAWRVRARFVKAKIIAYYDQQPASVQRFIETNQQKFKCCGIFGWQDYDKAPEDVPVSCCGKFTESPLLARLYRLLAVNGAARCSLDELKSRDPCNRFLYEIQASFFSSPSMVALIRFIYGFQLLLVAFALIIAIFG